MGYGPMALRSLWGCCVASLSRGWIEFLRVHFPPSDAELFEEGPTLTMTLSLSSSPTMDGWLLEPLGMAMGGDTDPWLPFPFIVFNIFQGFAFSILKGSLQPNPSCAN